MKKMMMLLLIATATMVFMSGCVCDGTERSFKEVDQKYATSGWSAAAIGVPIVGPIFIGIPMMLIKDGDYYKVLLNKPDTEAYEVLRHSQRFNFMYCPKVVRGYY